MEIFQDWQGGFWRNGLESGLQDFLEVGQSNGKFHNRLSSMQNEMLEEM
jgi:hypothetical protein